MEELRNEMVEMELMETEEVENESGNGWKVAGGIGLGVLAAALVGKFVVKPLVQKIKAKKEEKEAASAVVEIIEAEEETK